MRELRDVLLPSAFLWHFPTSASPRVVRFPLATVHCHHRPQHEDSRAERGPSSPRRNAAFERRHRPAFARQVRVCDGLAKVLEDGQEDGQVATRIPSDNARVEIMLNTRSLIDKEVAGSRGEHGRWDKELSTLDLTKLDSSSSRRPPRPSPTTSLSISERTLSTTTTQAFFEGIRVDTPPPSWPSFNTVAEQHRPGLAWPKLGGATAGCQCSLAGNLTLFSVSVLMVASTTTISISMCPSWGASDCSLSCSFSEGCMSSIHGREEEVNDARISRNEMASKTALSARMLTFAYLTCAATTIFG